MTGIRPHTLYFPISIDNIQKVPLIPKKNTDTNKLEQGKLQVAQFTQVLFDETHMKEGKMEGETAIFNIRGITELIEEQQVTYIFPYAETRIELNVPVLVFSHGRSMFKNALPVLLNHQG